jgi:hypothetical protein
LDETEKQSSDPFPGDHQTAFRESLHSLHTPLAVTKGYVQALLKHWDHLDDEQRRTYATKALEATGHITEALSSSELTLRPIVEAGVEAIEDRVRALEKAITSVPGVRAARVRGAADTSAQVDVLVMPERRAEPHLVIGEIRKATSELSLEVPEDNIRLVSVPGTLQAQGRRKLMSLVTRRTDDGFSVRVWLGLQGDILVGDAEADPEPGDQYRAVARAVLDAVSGLIEGHVDVREVDLIRVGSVGTATVCLSWAGRDMIGTARVARDQYDSIARATLDAINRSIAPRG